MSKNILLVGGNFINKGAEAMLKTVKHHIESKFPDSKFYTIVTKSQAKLAEESGFIPLFPDARPFVDRFIYYKSAIINRLGKVLPIRPRPFADITPVKKMESQIKTLDLTVDVSGYAYHDGRGYAQPIESLKAIRFSEKKGAPYLIMPQAWGSFNDVDVRKAVLQMLKAAKLFYARDEVSQKYLAELLSKNESEIPLCPDIAFGLPHLDKEIGAGLLKRAGWDGKKKLVVLSPNMRVYQRFTGADEDNPYIQLLLNLAQYIIKETNYDIVLIPNEIKPNDVTGQSPDDRLLCSLLNALIANPDRSMLFENYLTAEEVKSVIGNSDLLVASRFHSLIFGLSQGVPSMAISWSHKYRELFRLFDMEDFVMEDSDAVSDKAVKLFLELEGNQNSLREKIKSTNNEILARINEPLNALSKYLESDSQN